MSPAFEAELRAAHGTAPGYYEDWVDVLSERAELRGIAEMNANRWALLPADLGRLPREDLTVLPLLQGMALPYRLRNAVPYAPGAMFATNLRERWIAAAEVGGYRLYRRRE